MRKPDIPPIPKSMASPPFKIVYVAGAFAAWGILAYGLYFA